MDLSNITLAIPVFFLMYAGADMLLSSRRSTVGRRERRSVRHTADSVRQFSRMIGESGLNQAVLRIKGLRERLDLLLLRSGYPFGWKAEDLLFYKEACVVAAALVLWLTGTRDALTWVLSVAISFWLFDIYLHLRGSERKAQMQRDLPSFIDLMALLVEGGLDLMVAIERIFEKMNTEGALREEIQTLLQEARLGSSRKDILQRWAHRTDLADSQSLASLIIQSDEMGTPLAQMLRSYGEDMRNRRILRAEEIAAKIPVKILFPMMVFFFPIVFAILLGPVALEFLKGYK